MPDHHCGELLEALSLYIDHEASQTVCQEIERHLAGCVDCRAVLQTLEKTIALYRGTRADEALPADVRDRLMAFLELGGPAARSNQAAGGR